jgi:hypothetical protein
MTMNRDSIGIDQVGQYKKKNDIQFRMVQVVEGYVSCVGRHTGFVRNMKLHIL